MTREDVYACDALKVLAESDEAGIYIAMAGEGKQIFITGHPEYDRVTLKNEYIRDCGKGLNPEIPAEAATQKAVTTSSPTVRVLLLQTVSA